MAQLAKWQHRIREVVDAAIMRGNEQWGRAYATFLAGEVARLDRAFGRSAARSKSAAAARRDPYRIAARLLRSLGYSQREIAAMLKLSQSAVARLLGRRKDETSDHLDGEPPGG